MSIISRIRVGVNAMAALVPESRLEFIARANQGCIDALVEDRREPLEGVPEYAMCYQGGVPCASIGRCPVIKMRPSGR
jgi:hypothetical protein